MNFLNKMTTREAAIQRYGAIDFASRHWSNQNKWIEMFEIPHGWFPHWHVLETKYPVEHIALNKDLHEPFTRALTRIKNGGMGELLKTFDGCLNIRMVRGTNSSPSAHAYGLALDLNASENGLGQTNGGFFFHPEFVKCFTDQGFAWGGSFHSRKDPMHFSYCWEG
jgi:hypothetical protein